MPNLNENATNTKDPAVEALLDDLRDNLTPHAVAAIASWLQPASTNDSDINAKIRWFADRLAEAVGGWKQQSELTEELGL